MHFDALTLACVTNELKQTICPGRIQQVVMIDAHSVGLEVFSRGDRHSLLLCADPTASRLHLISEKVRRGGDEQGPLLLLLRKYARDALLIDVIQPDPTERVLELHFQHAEHGSTRLLLEPMGRLSNLLLLNPQGMIMECLHRVPAGERSQRVLLPARPYLPPPAQQKLPPLDDGSGNYYERLAALLDQDELLWKIINTQVAGVSPSQAREIAWRATGSATATTEQTDVVALIAALQQLWLPVQSGEWSPGVWRLDGQIVGFSSHEAHVTGRFEPLDSISQALEQFYAVKRARSPADSYAEQRQRMATLVEQARQRLRRQLDGLKADEPAPGESERVRSEAEWLIAYSGQVAPRQSVLTIDLGEDEQGESESLTIQLDPTHTPVEQAQQRFKRAGKLERAARIIPQRRAQLEIDLDYLDQLAVDLTLAVNAPEIASVRAELEALGLITAQKAKTNAVKPAKTGQPLEFQSKSGFVVLVGRSAKQNEKVTFELSHPRDLWLHVRGVPGSHVIIRSSGRPVDEESILFAAQLAAYHSKLRGEKSAQVIVTERRFVQHAPGGRPGQVTVHNERVVNATAELPGV